MAQSSARVVLLIALATMRSTPAAYADDASLASSRRDIDLSTYKLKTSKVKKTLAKIDHNASGVTFDGEHLFVVVNDPPKIVKFDTKGKHQDTFKLPRDSQEREWCDAQFLSGTGFHDLEGIVHIEGSRFAVVEERRCRVCTIDLDSEDLQCLDRIDLDICDQCNNQGLEGISFDHKENIFWIVKELDPRKVVSFSNNADVTSWNIDRSPIDFSGIYYDGSPVDAKGAESPTHHILLLSHESETLFEYAPGNAAPLSKLPLEECFEHVKTKKELEGKELKAEGVTMDHARNIYIIGEPDFLCKFEPK